jgi:alpha-glucosidase (family GH31 glycosyl hydrolase)
LFKKLNNKSMRKIYYLLALAFLFTACQSSVQITDSTSYLFKENRLDIQTKGETYTVSAVDDNIIKVVYADSLVSGERVYGPVLTQNIKAELKQQDDVLYFSTANIELKITFDPVNFTFSDRATGVKLDEHNGFIQKEDVTVLDFKLSEDERIYGTGSRSIPQNRRGYKFQCFNQANYGYGVGADFLNYSIPVFLSSNKYMVLIDNPARAWFDIGTTNDEVLEFASKGGNTAYYFINGENYKDIMGNYAKLTGTQPIPPIWAFGNLQSRFGYRTQQEAETVVDKMLEAGYPMDALIIDLYWFGEELQDGKMGKLAWDTVNWPNPDEMIASFAEKGVKTITVSEPFFTRKSKNFQYLSDNKLLGLDTAGNTMTMPYFYFGDAGLIDIFKPEARNWFWQQYKREKERGIAGFWGDLGEPEVHPDDMVHVNGFGHEVHGVYGHEWVAMLYENYTKDFPNDRLFKLGRAGYAGSQRYGLIPWSGDVARDWSGFQAQNDVLLGMSLSGMPYMHSDAGGFAMHPRDSMLYIRWMQYCVFTPVFRPHGDPNAPSEPIFYHKKVQDIIKKSIKLRYAMLPYNYTLGWKSEQTGQPMAMPMFYEFEEQNISDTLSTQHMWGENLLVAPIWQKSEKIRDIYLPEGDWYNFNDLSYFTGGNFITVDVKDESIPAFARGGSFITLSGEIMNTKEYQGDMLEVYYFLTKKNSIASGEVYFDDGKLKGAYAKGKYELLLLEGQQEEGKTTVSFSVEGDGYEGTPEYRTINLKVVGLEEKPEAVMVNEMNTEYKWENSILIIKGLTTTEKVNVLIQ